MSVAVGLLFCRITIAVLFGASALGKLSSRRDFELAIDGFQLLHKRRSIAVAATAVITAEAGTTLLVVLGGPLLAPGFLLAIALLATFSLVLVRALRRRMTVSCNCFGPGVRVISPSDVLRNLVMIVCAITGLTLTSIPHGSVTTGEVALVVGMSAVFVLTVSNLGDIAIALRRPL